MDSLRELLERVTTVTSATICSAFKGFEEDLFPVTSIVCALALKVVNLGNIIAIFFEK